MVSDITQVTAHYWNVVHGHKGFIAAQLSRVAWRHCSLQHLLSCC